MHVVFVMHVVLAPSSSSTAFFLVERDFSRLESLLHAKDAWRRRDGGNKRLSNLFSNKLQGTANSIKPQSVGQIGSPGPYCHSEAHWHLMNNA